MQWKPEKVLAISGSGVVGAIIEIVLTKMAFCDVKVVLSIEEGLDWLEQHQVDLIILDQTFTDVELSKAMDSIRQDGLASVPVVLLDEKLPWPMRADTPDTLRLRQPFSPEELMLVFRLVQGMPS